MVNHASQNPPKPAAVWGPPFRISVKPSPELLDARLDISIDTPAHGHISQSWTIEVSGFVLPWAPAAERKPIKLQFRVGDVEVWSTPIDLPRPDLESHPEFTPDHLCCGYSTVLPAFLQREDHAIDLWLYEERPGCEFYTIHLATLTFEAAVAPRAGSDTAAASRIREIGLLHITSIGRSGSSLLSKMLSLFDEIFVPQLFGQYGETTVLSHFVRTLAVLSSEGCYGALNQFERSSDILSLPNGYCHFDEGQLPPNLALRIQARVRVRAHNLLRDVAAECAEAARITKPRVCYWLEKNWNTLSASLAPHLFERYREIVLIRSLPSFWQSQFNYSKKIMTPGRHVADAKDTIEKYLNIARTALDTARGALVVRYEDLISNPIQELQRVAEHLDLPLTHAFAEKLSALVDSGDDFHKRLSTNGSVVEASPKEAPADLMSAIEDLPPEYRAYLREEIIQLAYDPFF